MVATKSIIQYTTIKEILPKDILETLCVQLKKITVGALLQ